MRLNALPFTEKLLRLKPKVVCFVGKKIWDVYESVIRKTATATATVAVPPVPEPSSVRSATSAVDDRLEQDQKPMPAPPTSSIKAEQRSKPNEESSTAAQRNGKRKKEEKIPFDWTQPRSFRLPHIEEGQITRYTYFWVVPNTSGLERTPVSPISSSL